MGVEDSQLPFVQKHMGRAPERVIIAADHRPCSRKAHSATSKGALKAVLKPPTLHAKGRFDLEADSKRGR
jgi:hypothetical protein